MDLLERRNVLMNSYGRGSFHDGALTENIARLDAEIAANLAWRPERPTRWVAEMPSGLVTVRRARNAGRFYCWDVTWPDGRTTRRDTREAAMEAAAARVV